MENNLRHRESVSSNQRNHSQTTPCRLNTQSQISYNYRDEDLETPQLKSSKVSPRLLNLELETLIEENKEQSFISGSIFWKASSCPLDAALLANFILLIR